MNMASTRSPRDPLWNFGDDVWYLKNMRANDAWDLDSINTAFTHEGSNSITIAVMSSGLYFDPDDPDGCHPDIPIDVLWVNQDEIPDNDCDEDSNDATDDIYGWNFIIDSGEVEDLQDNGWWFENKVGDYDEKYIWPNHGTRITGLISSVLDNPKGSAGIVPNVKIMTLKIADANWQSYDDESEELEDYYYDLDQAAADAFDYAMKNGADIILMPFGMPRDSYKLSDMINSYYFGKSPIPLLVASNRAGNHPLRDLAIPGYKSSVICVGAVDSNNEKASYSVHDTVHSQRNQNIEVSAWCGDVDANDKDMWLSNDLGFETEWIKWPTDDEPAEGWPEDWVFEGTDYAAAQVAGAAGLIMSYKPSLSTEEVRRILHITAKDVGSTGWDRPTGYGCVDLGYALRTAVESKPELGHRLDKVDQNLDYSYAMSGYEPALAVDANGYIHIAAVYSYNPGDTEICYIQRNPNNDIRIQPIRIEQALGSGDPSFDPAISVDRDHNINIVWWERHNNNMDYRIWYVQLDMDGNIQAAFIVHDTPMGQLVNPYGHLNLLSDVDANRYYVTFEAGPNIPDTHILKFDAQTNIYWIWNINDATHPTAGICKFEGAIEDIVIAYEIWQQGQPTGIQVSWIRDLGGNPQLISAQDILPPEGKRFADVDIDVDYKTRIAHGVMRKIDALDSTGGINEGTFAERPYAETLKYFSMDDNGVHHTYNDAVMEISFAPETPHIEYSDEHWFNPQIVKNNKGEVRIVADYPSYYSNGGAWRKVISTTLRDDGRLYIDKSSVYYGHVRVLDVSGMGANQFSYSFAQVETTDINYEIGYVQEDTYNHDGSFHVIHLDFENPGAPIAYSLYTTKQRFDNYWTEANPATTDFDYAIDYKNGHHVVTVVEDANVDNQIHYTYFPTLNQAPAIDLDITTSTDDSVEPQIVTSIGIYGTIIVYIVWKELKTSDEDLHFYKFRIDPDSPQTYQAFDYQDLDGTETYSSFSRFIIKPFTDYAYSSPSLRTELYVYIEGEVEKIIVVSSADIYLFDLSLTGSANVEFDLDAEGDVYMVYNKFLDPGYVPKLKKIDITDESTVFDKRLELGTAVQDGITGLQIALDKHIDRTGKMKPKNNQERNIHIVFSTWSDDTYTKAFVYYDKYDTNGDLIFGPVTIFPVEVDGWNYFLSQPASTEMILTRDNEIGLMISTTVDTSAYWDYCWDPIDQHRNLWFMHLTNNAQIISHPTIVNKDRTTGLWDFHIGVSTGNKFNVLYTLWDFVLFPPFPPVVLKWAQSPTRNINFA
jgi:hypothetical protein